MRHYSLYVGIAIVFLGFMFNEIFLEMTIVEDGSIDSVLISIFIIISQIIMVGFGFYLYAKRPVQLSHLILFSFSILFALSLFEITSRFLLKESSYSYGVLCGLELPPKAVIPVKLNPVRDEKWYKSLVVNGEKITTYDLWGVMRYDPDLGWKPQENAISANGWYRTNNLGARSDYDIKKDKVSGKRRVLLFGDSFAQGSRLPQEETWTSMLCQQYPEIEIANFGVDGYGMGQALLMYMRIHDRLDYDSTLFLFVPSADLWRDINTIRYLASGWGSYSISPRFVIEQGKLKLVKSPYENLPQFYEINYPTLSMETREFLKKNDRFYFPELYEDLPVFKYLISYKLLSLNIGNRKVRRLHRRVFENFNSEAWKVTLKIFDSAKKLAEERYADFTIAILPIRSDIVRSLRDGDFQEHWHSMVMMLNIQGFHTIDLMPTLSINSELLDQGYDGSHYGQKACGLIAGVLGSELKSHVEVDLMDTAREID